MADNNPRPLYSFSGRSRFSDFCFSRLPRSSAENHPDSAGFVGSSHSSRGDFVTDFEAGYRPSSRQPVSFVVPDLCYSQTYRGSSVYPQLEGYQCLYSPSALSYGNSCVHSSHHLSTGLGGLDRPQGCLSPRPDSSDVPSSSRFSVPGSYLSVSGSSFWPQRLPVGVHPFGLHSRGVSSLSRDPHPVLPGRLADSGLFSESSPVPSSGVASLCSVRRVPDQLGEVLPGSFPGSDLSRSSSRLSSSGCSSCGPSDSYTHPGSFAPGYLSFSSCLPLAAVSGSPSQSQRLGCGLPLFDASSPDLFPAPLPPPAGLPRPPDSFVSTDQGSLSDLGVSRLPSCRKAVRPSPSYYDSDHRRFQPRLGCFVTPSLSVGSLVASGLQASHQSAGAESSSPGSSGLSVSHFRSFGSSQVGQLNSGCVHQPSGRDSFDSSVRGYSPSSFLVPPGEDFPFGVSHSGSAEFGRDFLSRGNFLPSEWSLHPSVFQQILRVSSPPLVDLFASSRNHLLPRYCARADDSSAWALDAFFIPWSDFLGFAFPPFALLPRVLEKVALDQTALLLVAPFWPKMPWFPRLLSLLAGHPRSLPVFPDLLRQPISLIQHANPATLHLTLWPLSARPGERRAFLSGLPIWQQNISDHLLAPLMIPDSGLSTSGVTSPG